MSGHVKRPWPAVHALIEARSPVHVERNRYSVPASFANRPVSVRVYADRLVIAAEGQLIAEHQRSSSAAIAQAARSTIGATL